MPNNITRTGGGATYLDNRRRAINENQPTGPNQTDESFKQQQEKFNKEMEKLEAPPSFKKSRGLYIFKGNYLAVSLSVVLLIINTILRGFNGAFWYIIPNIAFLITVIIFGGYFNPLDYASDTEKYIRPRVDKVYLDLQSLAKQLLFLSGNNLHKDAKSSYRQMLILLLLGSLFGILFYNSGFVILSIPFLIMYIIRTFAAGATKENAKQVGLAKWIMFWLLLLNTVLSAYWKTPFGFEMFALISLLNSTELWMKNTELYGVDKIQQLRAEEQRRRAESAARQQQAQQQMQQIPPGQQQLPPQQGQFYPQQGQQQFNPYQNNTMMQQGSNPGLHQHQNNNFNNNNRFR